MPFTFAPFPTQDEIVDTRRKPTRVFIDWVTALIEDVDAAPFRFDPVQLSTQEASIGTTSIVTPSLSEGLYRVSYRARITRAATTSSSLTVTIGHTESAVTLTQSGAAMTANAVTSVQSGTYLIHIDGATPVTYSTSYSSTGATGMQYRLSIVLEQVHA